MLRACRRSPHRLSMLCLNMPTLRTATRRDAEAIRTLLELNSLPTADLLTAQPEFIVAHEGPTLVGAGALQCVTESVLLRSVVVLAEHRNSGVGRLIVKELERRAREEGFSELILLTQSAQRFFERQGYRVIERERAPDGIKKSEEFRSLCPQSAVCMSKAL